MSTSAGVPTVIQPLDLSIVAQMLVGLLVVLALMWMAALVVRRLGASRLSASGPLKVVAGLPLGARERVVLLQVDDAKVLVGVTPGGIETLYVHRPCAAAVTDVSPDFAQQFGTAMKDTQAP